MTVLCAGRAQVLKISTGSKALDDMLGGGVDTGSITEFCGPAVAVTTQLNSDKGGRGIRVIFVDTRNSFRPERIVEIAKRFGLAGDEVLSNIFHCRPQTHEQQMELVVVDTISTLFESDFNGLSQVGERQQKLYQHMTALGNVARQFSLAVVNVNQITADPCTISMVPSSSSAAVRSIGGHVILRTTTTRVMLKAGRGQARIAQICHSRQMPLAEATFAISAVGIVDSEQQATFDAEGPQLPPCQNP
ncbi:DNA recombination and repair protein Rad51 [Tribonema minus]|uniref:DNA recombination and repair protein Rad51 n=1 Tax=Tribonema minus TaxID=303371 RepID=A0A835ZFU4_9STRA|nr:DNA recombination and repair protein Rad51 [Tribonema minus]